MYYSALKPANTADNNSFPGQRTEKLVTKPTQVSQADVWNKTHFRGFPVSSNWKADDDPQPTRIMVFKPSLEKASNSREGYTSPSLSPRTPHGENCFMEGVYLDAQQSRDMAKEITNSENLGSLQMDDPFFSSVFSGGYNGDESSPNKSENEFAAGSHSEAMSPASRFSWGYINQFASCSSSVSHVPRARESSVCREAKKRLSRRWNAMGLNESSQQHRHTHSRSSSTLGEMLALSEIKKLIRSPVNNEEEPMGSCPLRDNETADYSPRILTRSKSAPLSADGNYEWVNDRILHPELAKSSNEKELLKVNSLKLLVSSLFFSKNQRPDKVNSNATFCKDGYSATQIRIQGLQIGDITEGTGSHEVGLSVTEPVLTVKLMESQDQPSPILVLEPFFADDDSRSGDSAGILSTEHPVARTLCSCADTVSACPFNLSSVCSGPEEEQDWCIIVQALVSSDACVGWWHAPQTPLDPLLRDKYVNGTNHFMHEAKGRRWANRKLVFDSVNEALKDLAQLELETNIKDSAQHPKNATPILVDQVWATMSRWISDKARCVSSDAEDINCNVAVERVARREVAGKGWFDGYMEMNRVGNDIELKLVDELLEEAVLQLTARYFQNSLCRFIVV
uniref:DUF4378 domain-containing protein n=1 Tax=Kalanchoe fedtschenkoi TaxID=63787 RepID=A0A7N0TPC7_KALFE